MDIKLKVLILALHLVSKYQMDMMCPLQVSVSGLCQPHFLNLEVAKYIVMADQLILIKSRKLLPKVAEVNGGWSGVRSLNRRRIPQVQPLGNAEAKLQKTGPVLFKAPTGWFTRCGACAWQRHYWPLFGFSNIYLKEKRVCRIVYLAGWKYKIEDSAYREKVFDWTNQCAYEI